MEREQVQEQVLKIVSEIMGTPVEDLTLETRLIQDLGADSLTVLDIMTECEEYFKITIADDELENLKTIEDAVNYLHTNC